MTDAATLSDSLAAIEPPVARLRPRDLFAMAVVALLLRIILAMLAARVTGVSLVEQAYVNDGGGYIHYGEFIAGRANELTVYERRLFPGTPAAIAGLLCLGVPPAWAGFLPSWLGAAVACVGAAVLFRRATVGWALAILLPDYLMVSSVVASEGLMLGLSVWGLVLARRSGLGAAIAGGLLLGFAGVTRPMACFAVIGFIAAEFSYRRWRTAILVGGVSAVTVALAMLWLRGRLGSALEPAHGYRDGPAGWGGDLLTWPFVALVYHTIHYPIGLAKDVFVWAHVALAFGTLALLGRRAWREPDNGLARLALVWAAGNTLFCLCVGSVWGFLCFPRYLTPALPATFYSVDRWLPRRWWSWLALAVLSFGMCIVMVTRRQIH